MVTKFLYPRQAPRSVPTSGRWHDWVAQPPNPRGGMVRCMVGGVQSIVDAGCRDPGWPIKGVQWEETGKCRPLQLDSEAA